MKIRIERVLLILLIIVLIPIMTFAGVPGELPEDDLGGNDEHIHSAASYWSSNDTYHWHECNNGCGEKLDYASHTWNSGATANGIVIYTCTICGATRTERLLKVNPLRISSSKKTYKAKRLKKSKKAFVVKVTKFKGKVTYSLNDAAKTSKIKVKKTGSSSKAVKYKIIVPKKCKKGIYEVNINAAGGSGYQAGSKTVRIVVK